MSDLNFSQPEPEGHIGGSEWWNDNQQGHWQSCGRKKLAGRNHRGLNWQNCQSWGGFCLFRTPWSQVSPLGQNSTPLHGNPPPPLFLLDGAVRLLDFRLAGASGNLTRLIIWHPRQPSYNGLEEWTPAPYLRTTYQSIKALYDVYADKEFYTGNKGW